FPDIVRDVLTNLTQGVSQEVHRVTYNPAASPPEPVPDIVLQRRPVRRVSLVSGFLPPPAPDADPVPVVFSLNDYTLVATTPQTAEALSTVRYLPFGNKPAPGTDVTVNYYPRTVEPSVITDLNVGSVARTLVEALSRELAGLYVQVNLAYDAGFVGSATDSSL